MNEHKMINKMNHERNDFTKRSLEKKMRARTHYFKGGASTHLFEGSSTHYLEGSSTHYLRGHEHSSFEEQLNREQVNECK